jgi:hypothetical protein
MIDLKLGSDDLARRTQLRAWPWSLGLVVEWTAAFLAAVGITGPEMAELSS